MSHFETLFENVSFWDIF